MKYKSLIALALTTTCLTGFSYALSNVDDEKALEKSLSPQGDILHESAFSALLDQHGFVSQFFLSTSNSISADLNFSKIGDGEFGFSSPKPDLAYSLGINFDGHLYTQYTGNLKFIYGGNISLSEQQKVELTKKYFDEELGKKDFGTLSPVANGSFFVGVDSAFGQLKFSKLNTPNASIGGDIFARSRDGSQLKRAFSFDSADFGGFTFGLFTGTGEQSIGWDEDVVKKGQEAVASQEAVDYQPAVPAQEAVADVITEPAHAATQETRFFGGSLAYKQDAFSLKLIGLVDPKGIHEGQTRPKPDLEEASGSLGYTLLLEGGYAKDGLSATIAARRSVDNTAWLNELAGEREKQDDKIYGAKFTAHEFAAKASYALGSFTPRIGFAIGLATESGKDATKITLPGYKELSAGLDYQFNDDILAKLSFDKTLFDDAFKAENNQKISADLTYQLSKAIGSHLSFAHTAYEDTNKNEQKIGIGLNLSF